ncbi:hypothetical protein NPA08_03800 [Mycoplasmopsis citelli]|uniref:hypothetical protein n=1 Tax=Mycoplasmopsis citelli TaxID=171281 RepID=UPI002113F8C9|nr:hypothetical protein [Mycoplasmopsis citelli]UUD36051.1 hypothetical protein NPA08_03800 [Mycoplasmopsis citelli]
MVDNLVTNAYIIMIVYTLYFLPRISILYYSHSSKWKFFVQLFDLFFLKIKYNPNTWFLDTSLKEAIVTLIGKIKYQKKAIWINLFFEFLVNTSVILIISLLFLYGSYELALFSSLRFLLAFIATSFNIFYLVMLFYKILKFEYKFEKLNLVNLEEIKPIKKSGGNYNIQKFNFLFVVKNIYSKKMKNIILNSEEISNTLGKEAKIIMYIYRYDIDNFNAPYFVFENERMIKNYEEKQW